MSKGEIRKYIKQYKERRVFCVHRFAKSRRKRILLSLFLEGGKAESRTQFLEGGRCRGFRFGMMEGYWWGRNSSIFRPTFLSLFFPPWHNFSGPLFYPHSFIISNNLDNAFCVRNDQTIDVRWQKTSPLPLGSLTDKTVGGAEKIVCATCDFTYFSIFLANAKRKQGFLLCFLTLTSVVKLIDCYLLCLASGVDRVCPRLGLTLIWLATERTRECELG